MSLLASRLHSPETAADWFVQVDLAGVRGLLVPLSLYWLLNARKTPSRSDVIPPNLLSWTLALAIVLSSFSFSEVMVPAPGDQRTLVAVAASAVLLGFLVLANQSGPFAQVIGALRIENGIALMELGIEGHRLPWGIKLALELAFLGTVLLFRNYLAGIPATTPLSERGLAESKGRGL
jgi:hydrogenase-4 membrane subunit HyfE